MSKTAVHFGAGNIGRGFVGLVLHNSGYHVTFADVNADLIDQIAAANSYRVIEVGEGGKTTEVTEFSAINSATHEDDVVKAIADADIVTTAVGPNILRFVAPVIAKGLAAREASKGKLAVMACENAINATDTLVGEIDKAAGADFSALKEKAIFANTAVDRIVPAQEAGLRLDVKVEPYFEWAIQRPPFGNDAPNLEGVTWVDDLAPYIERKLFTVNTGHATTAYHGRVAGHELIADAIADPAVYGKVRATLEETKALLVAKYGFEDSVQSAYMEKILKRFTNKELPDRTDRVGRQPLRKLSRHERLVGPAAELAERGTQPAALLDTMGAALAFDVPEDPESVEMKQILGSMDADAATQKITGLTPEHPLYAGVKERISAAQSA